MSLFTESVTIEDREVSGEDDYGNDVYTTTSSTSPAWVQLRTSSENIEARQQSVDGLWLYLPPGTPIEATSAVLYDGRRYEVDGEPGRQPGGFVVEGFVQVALRRVTG